jgi:AraC-like DNA-binding protein
MRIAQEHVTHPAQAFRFLHLRLDEAAGARHRHPQVELTWIERGCGVRFVGGSTEAFDAGDMVLLGPDVPHAWLGQPLAGDEAFVAWVVQLPYALFRDPVLPELSRCAALVDAARQGLAVTGAARDTVAAQLKAMHGATPLARLAALLLAFDALHVAAAGGALRPIASHAAPAASPGTQASRIDRVIGWLHDNLGRETNIEQAAAVAHVTPAAFSRFFKRETGRTFTDYANDLRCSEACVLLRQSDRPVAEIAERCGFQTASHFNRQFAARLGVAPRGYRKQLR